MDETIQDGVTVTENGVEVQKSLAIDQSQQLVVEFTLQSDREEPVEIRLIDHIPESVPMEDVDLYCQSGAAVWSKDNGQVVLERWLDPGEKFTTSYCVSGDDDEFASQSLLEPELNVFTLHLEGGNGLSSTLYRSPVVIFLAAFVIFIIASLGFSIIFFIVIELSWVLVRYDPFWGIFVLLSISIVALGISTGTTLAGMWMAFTKADQPGWSAIIPIYNLYIMLKIGDNPGVLLFGLFIPIYNVSIYSRIVIDVAKAFGRGIGFGLGLAFLWFIFWPLLGFGDYTYQEESYQGGRDCVIKAVEWKGNLDSPEFANATTNALRSKSLSSLSVPKLQFAIEAVEAYQDFGAADVDLDEARQKLILAWEANTGIDWESMKSA